MKQIDLFDHVAHAYTDDARSGLDNDELYARVAQAVGACDEQTLKQPVGVAGQKHNLFHRRIRWYQQDLKRLGILEHVPSARGKWRLTDSGRRQLSPAEPKTILLGFSTDLGIAVWASCADLFQRINEPIALCVTSPPYPLAKPRAYGNPNRTEYVDFICRCIEPIAGLLIDGASLALVLSNDIFCEGTPARSLYCERLVIALHERLGLELMDRMVWRNESKPPSPVQWASKTRQQLNAGFEHVYWFTNNPRACRTDNRRVLQAHTERQQKLMTRGGESRARSFSDGAYSIRPGKSYSTITEGRIPRNVLSFGHSCADQQKNKREMLAHGLPPHGAPMPLSLAKFIISFMSAEGDLVVDPFAGSFTVAKAAEQLGRRWVGCEIMAEYVAGASFRFRNSEGFAYAKDLGDLLLHRWGQSA